MKQIRAITIAINSSSQRKLRFLKLQATRSWKLIQDICIRWNFIYLMLRRAYQLRDTIDTWIEKFLTDAKIQAIRLKKNEWSLVLLVDNMLNSFYELTLIISRIINVDIHLEFRMFDALFNHFNVIETIVRDNACTSQALVLRACELAFNKLAKYYFKTKSKDELIYNLAMILNSTQKLNLYQDWDANENDSHFYYDKYRKEFKNYFHRYYEEKTTTAEVRAQVTNDVDQIMQYDNAIDHLLTML